MTWRCSGFQEFRSSIENAVVRKVDDFENNGQLNFFMNLFFIEPQVKKKINPPVFDIICSRHQN